MTHMNIKFDCSCGTEISDLARGGPETNVTLPCPDCGAIYAVTITELNHGVDSHRA